MVDKNTRTYFLFKGSPMVDVLHKLDEKVSKLTDKKIVSIIEEDDYRGFAFSFLYDEIPRKYFKFYLTEHLCRAQDIDGLLSHYAKMVAKKINQSNPSVSSAGM